MTEIFLETFIDAPVQICFDLSRSIDLHKISFEHTNERAVAGKTSGLIEKDEFVTWRARHFGVEQTLSVKITAMNAPFFFCDEMTEGAFKSMRHEHFFAARGGSTLMTDKFVYEVPFRPFGRIFDWLILEKYMTKLLQTRNSAVRRIAESDEWKKILS